MCSQNWFLLCNHMICTQRASLMSQCKSLSLFVFNPLSWANEGYLCSPDNYCSWCCSFSSLLESTRYITHKLQCLYRTALQQYFAHSFMWWMMSAKKSGVVPHSWTNGNSEEWWRSCREDAYSWQMTKCVHNSRYQSIVI